MSPKPANLDTLPLELLLLIINHLPPHLRSVARYSLSRQCQRLHTLLPSLAAISRNDFLILRRYSHYPFIASAECFRCLFPFPVHRLINIHDKNVYHAPPEPKHISFCLRCYTLVKKAKPPGRLSGWSKIPAGGPASDYFLSQEITCSKPEWLLHEVQWRPEQEKIEVRVAFEDIVGPAWNRWRRGRTKWRAAHPVAGVVSVCADKARKKDEFPREGWVSLTLLWEIMEQWEGLFPRNGRPLARAKMVPNSYHEVAATVRIEPVTVERLLRLYLEPEKEVAGIVRGLKGGQPGWGSTEEKERILEWIEGRVVDGGQIVQIKADGEASVL